MICARCGGTGEIRIRDGIYAEDAIEACPACRRYCRACGEWVAINGHECPQEQPA